MSPLGDPGSWWTLIERVRRGERLYSDIYLQYGPVSPLLVGLWGRVFGVSSASFLIMNWLPAVLLGLILLQAARPYLTETERIVLALLVVGLGALAPGSARLILPYSPAAVHALVFSTLALRLLQRDSPKPSDPWIAGALAGLALCGKQEIGLAAGLALCAPAIVSPSRARAWLLPMGAGFSITAAVGLLPIFAGTPLESLRNDSHFWPVAPVPESWKHLYGIAAGFLIRGTAPRVAGAVLALALFATVLALVGVLAAPARRPSRIVLLVGVAVGLLVAHRWTGTTLWRADVLTLSMVVSFAVALCGLARRSLPGRVFLVAFGLFAGLVGARTAFGGWLGWGPYSGVAQVCTALTWALFAFVCLPSLLVADERPRRITRRTSVAVVLSLAVYQAASGVWSLREPTAIATKTPRGTVFVNPEAHRALTLIAENVRPGERALVLPLSDGIEALFGLLPASPYLYYSPGWLDERAEDRLVRWFRAQPPDVVVVSSRSTWEYGVEPFGRGFGRRLASWLEANYVLAAREPGVFVLRPRGGR